MRRELLDGEERSLTRVLLGVVHPARLLPPRWRLLDYGTRDSTAFSGAARSLAVYALVLIGVSLLQLPLLLVISLCGDPARRWLEERLVMTLHAHKRGTDDSHDPGRSHRPLRFNCVWVTAPLIRLWLTLFSSVGAALLCMSLPAWPARERTPAEMAAALYALSALLAEWDEISTPSIREGASLPWPTPPGVSDRRLRDRAGCRRHLSARGVARLPAHRRRRGLQSSPTGRPVRALSPSSSCSCACSSSPHLALPGPLPLHGLADAARSRQKLHAGAAVPAACLHRSADRFP